MGAFVDVIVTKIPRVSRNAIARYLCVVDDRTNAIVCAWFHCACVIFCLTILPSVSCRTLTIITGWVVVTGAGVCTWFVIAFVVIFTKFSVIAESTMTLKCIHYRQIFTCTAI